MYGNISINNDGGEFAYSRGYTQRNAQKLSDTLTTNSNNEQDADAMNNIQHKHKGWNNNYDMNLLA